MMSFKEFLEEDKKQKGRPAKSSTYYADRDFMKSKDMMSPDKRVSYQVWREKKRLLDVLRANDFELSKSEDELSISELTKIVADNTLAMPAVTLKAWQKFEIDVGKGIEKLLYSKVFISKKTKKPICTIGCTVIGGGKDPTESDVKVFNPSNHKQFFTECKLTYVSAGYFKYALKVKGDKIEYAHDKYLKLGDDDNYVSNDSIIKLLQRDILFTNEIDLTQFLNDLVKSHEVKQSWQDFLKNIEEVNNQVKKSSEFKDFAKDIDTLYNFPEDFKKITKVFDLYRDFYINKYNENIDALFELITSEKIKRDKSHYKITGSRSSTKKVEDDVVFKTLNDLYADVMSQNAVNDETEFKRLTDELKTIELKFTKILKSLDIGVNNISAMMKINDKSKLKYFFKLFVSSVGRKQNGKNTSLSIEDPEGNLQLCYGVKMSNSRLGQMITDFYVKHDHCAYIQVKENVFIFDPKFNPLNLPDLPVYKDNVTEFNVALKISSQLNKIFLDIRAIEPANIKSVSFIQSDANYVLKKIKSIEVDL